jgi:hypothetical protein
MIGNKEPALTEYKFSSKRIPPCMGIYQLNDLIALAKVNHDYIWYIGISSELTESTSNFCSRNSNSPLNMM